MEALQRRSTLALKTELSALTGTATSSGTTVTGTGTQFNTDLKLGDVIGTYANGFRRVVNIASATSLTVDSAFAPTLSGATLLKQEYGVDPTVAAANIVEFVDFTLDPERSEINRNVVRDTFDELAPISGEETVKGDITVELHGSGTAGVIPNADPLFICTFGERNTSTASTTAAGSTTTSIVLSSGGGANFRVGDAVLIDPAGGTAYEVSWITAINTDTLTISPALSAAPAAGRAVGAGVHYKLSKNELKSFWSQFYRGDITIEKYRGCKVASATFDYKIGTTINPKFTIEAKDTVAPVAGSCTLGAGTFDSGNVHVARYMAVKIGGVAYPLSGCAFTVNNALYAIKDITSAGTNKIMRTARSVSGSFELAYEDASFETAFRNGTVAEMIIVSSDGNQTLTPGNIAAIRFPKVKYTKASKSNDQGIFRYNISFKAILTNGEDSITSFSLL